MHEQTHTLSSSQAAAVSLQAQDLGASVVNESTPPHLHLGYATDRWFVGGSLSVPFGSRVLWPATWARRFDLINAELTVLSVSAHGGLTFGPLSFAAGAFIDRGSLDLVRAIDFIDEAEGLAEQARNIVLLSRAHRIEVQVEADMRVALA